MPDLMGGILTKGLGGDCTALIIGPFRLKLVIDLVDVNTGGTGGTTAPSSIPRIGDRNQDNLDKILRFYIKMGDNEIRREYMVSESMGKKAIKIANWVNTTLHNVSVRTKKFKRVLSDIKVKFISK
jgi:hypothetical protein